MCSQGQAVVGGEEGIGLGHLAAHPGQVGQAFAGLVGGHDEGVLAHLFLGDAGRIEILQHLFIVFGQIELHLLDEGHAHVLQLCLHMPV